LICGGIFVVPVESGWRLMEVDRGYNGRTFVVLKLFSNVRGEQWKKFGRCSVWRYGGAGLLKREMGEGWKETMKV